MYPANVNIRKYGSDLCVTTIAGGLSVLGVLRLSSLLMSIEQATSLPIPRPPPVTCLALLLHVHNLLLNHMWRPHSNGNIAVAVT